MIGDRIGCVSDQLLSRLDELAHTSTCSALQLARPVSRGDCAVAPPVHLHPSYLDEPTVAPGLMDPPGTEWAICLLRRDRDQHVHQRHLSGKTALLCAWRAAGCGSLCLLVQSATDATGCLCWRT